MTVTLMEVVHRWNFYDFFDEIWKEILQNLLQVVVF